MRITEKQEEILDNLTCERLRDNDINCKLIQNFENKKGTLIVDYLKKYGWQEDKEGNTAFYVVKTKENDILMFFSLKCGELFDSLFNEEETAENYEEYLLIVQALQNADINSEEQENAIKHLKMISKKYGIPIHQALNKVLHEAKTKEKMLTAFKSEKVYEENSNISRVNMTYPGVELVHFCVNESAKEKWKNLNMQHPVGEVIFWKFIVPKFFAVQDIVGCEYAFLFAADLSEDSTLINYYNISLKFEMDEEIGTNKPIYDFACAFMCQKLSKMKENREIYFDSFNIDTSDILI